MAGSVAGAWRADWNAHCDRTVASVVELTKSPRNKITEVVRLSKNRISSTSPKSKPKEACEFENDLMVVHGRAFQGIIALATAALVVNQKQIAARAVDEIQPGVGAELIGFAVVLQERVEKQTCTECPVQSNRNQIGIQCA